VWPTPRVDGRVPRGRRRPSRAGWSPASPRLRGRPPAPPRRPRGPARRTASKRRRSRPRPAGRARAFDHGRRVGGVQGQHVEALAARQRWEFVGHAAVADLDGLLDAGQRHVLAGDVSEVRVGFIRRHARTDAPEIRGEDTGPSPRVQDAVARLEAGLTDDEADVAGIIGAPVRSRWLKRSAAELPHPNSVSRWVSTVSPGSTSSAPPGCPGPTPACRPGRAGTRGPRGRTDSLTLETLDGRCEVTVGVFERLARRILAHVGPHRDEFDVVVRNPAVVATIATGVGTSRVPDAASPPDSAPRSRLSGSPTTW